MVFAVKKSLEFFEFSHVLGFYMYNPEKGDKANLAEILITKIVKFLGLSDNDLYDEGDLSKQENKHIRFIYALPRTESAKESIKNVLKMRNFDQVTEKIVTYFYLELSDYESRYCQYCDNVYIQNDLAEHACNDDDSLKVPFLINIYNIIESVHLAQTKDVLPQNVFSYFAKDVNKLVTISKNLFHGQKRFMDVNPFTSIKSREVWLTCDEEVYYSEQYFGLLCKEGDGNYTCHCCNVSFNHLKGLLIHTIQKEKIFNLKTCDELIEELYSNLYP